MKRSVATLVIACGAAIAQPRDYPVKPVPFTPVHVTDGFWAPRIETNRTVTIPFAFQKDEETGRVDNLIRAAEALSGEMTVWLANSESSVTPAPFPTLTTAAAVTTSGSKNPLPIQDGDNPRASNDGSYYFDWWPQGTASGGPNRVTSGWVEYHWEKAVTVSQSDTYGFDDTGRGGVRVPAGWRILYRDGAEWKPVRNAGAWGAERDKFNHVSFDAVTTTALRLEVDFQPTFSAGVERWRVK